MALSGLGKSVSMAKLVGERGLGGGVAVAEAEVIRVGGESHLA